MLSSFLAKFSCTIMERILLEKEILLWKLLLLLLRQYGLLSVISIFAYGKIPKEGTFTGPLLFSRNNFMYYYGKNQKFLRRMFTMKKLNAFWEKLIDWASKAGLYLLTCFGVGYGICSIIRVAVNLKELIKYVYHWEDLD